MLLCAFEGLFDAGGAATGAISHMESGFDSETVAEIDPDRFIDFSMVRPRIQFNDEGRHEIKWPSTEVIGCSTDGSRDLVLITGREPHLRWSSFTSLLTQVVWRTGTEMVVTLGAAPAVVAHSRDLGVTGSTADTFLAGRLGLNQPTYEGPTGIVGVINSEFETKHIPVISLRVDVPHYVPGRPSPKATQALLRRIEAITRIPTNWEDLNDEVISWVERVERAVSSDPDSRSYVDRLEEQADRNRQIDEEVSDIGAEIEQFLRDLNDKDN